MDGPKLQILLVDDNEMDVMAFQRGLKKHRIENELTVAVNGSDALDVLRGTHGKRALSRPYVIFLDLNMPVMNGIEFLEELSREQDDVLRSSVIFVLTTPDFDEDLLDAHESQVTGYILKTNLMDACLQLLDLPVTLGQVIQSDAS